MLTSTTKMITFDIIIGGFLFVRCMGCLLLLVWFIFFCFFYLFICLFVLSVCLFVCLFVCTYLPCFHCLLVSPALVDSSVMRKNRESQITTSLNILFGKSKSQELYFIACIIIFYIIIINSLISISNPYIHKINLTKLQIDTYILLYT